MATISSGLSTANKANVNANFEMNVALSSAAANSGFARLADKNAVGAQFSDHGRVKVGQESVLLYDPVDGAAMNISLWNTPAPTSLALAIASGFIVLNSGALTTVNGVVQCSSIKSCPFLSHYPLYFHCKAKVPNVPQANSTTELGFGTATGTSNPTDGVFFRWASSSVFQCVVNNGGSEVTTTVTAPSINVVHTFAIIYTHNTAQFEVDGAIVATVAAATGVSSLTSSTRVPVFARVFNGASVPSVAPQLFLAEINVAQMDVNWTKPWETTMCQMQRGAYVSPVTGFLQTANHANSTSPTSATLSNTAAGYTTLGGRFQFAAPAGAATDFALFGFQVPAGYQLTVNGIHISSLNTGAAVATTATVLDWFAAANGSAISLATAESSGVAWAYRRMPLGLQSFVVGAAIGAQVPDITRQLINPIVVDGGRFFVVGLQIPVGTATASQVIRGDVTIDGFFE